MTLVPSIFIKNEVILKIVGLTFVAAASFWGGAFWKTNAYAPYPIWLWLNGYEWAKRQLEKAGIGYEALDNGFRSCDNPAK